VRHNKGCLNYLKLKPAAAVSSRTSSIRALLASLFAIVVCAGRSRKLLIDNSSVRPSDPSPGAPNTWGKTMRFRDPRRFGSLHWSKTPLQHKLLKSLGPEPLGDDFDASYLWEKSRGRRVSVKQFIMNAQVVVGVGNIYASEALFLACINPRRAAGRISLQRYERLVVAIREVLGQAVRHYVTFTAAMVRQAISSNSLKRMVGKVSPAGAATHRSPPSYRASVRPIIASNARPDQARPTFCSRASLTAGDTNSEISPPRVATSRTSVEEMNVNLSVGVRKAVSTSCVRCRFILAN